MQLDSRNTILETPQRIIWTRVMMYVKSVAGDSIENKKWLRHKILLEFEMHRTDDSIKHNKIVLFTSNIFAVWTRD